MKLHLEQLCWQCKLKRWPTYLRQVRVTHMAVSVMGERLEEVKEQKMDWQGYLCCMNRTIRN